MTDLPDSPEDVTRKTVRARYAAPQEWHNFGDASPGMHGGVWLRWDGTGWDVVETVPLADTGITDDFSPGEQWSTRGHLGFSSVVTRSGEWSDDMADFQETLHRGHGSPLGAVLDGDLTGDVAHFCVSTVHGTPPDRGREVSEETYTQALNALGVTPRIDP